MIIIRHALSAVCFYVIVYRHTHIIGLLQKTLHLIVAESADVHHYHNHVQSRSIQGIK